MATKFQQTVYEFTMKGSVDILKKIHEICKLQYGVYKAVGAFHDKPEEPHTHFAIALRDKPNFSAKSLNKYFNLPVGSTMPRPVTTGRSKLSKLAAMHAYFTDETSHPGELNTPPVYYKYDPTKHSLTPGGKKLTPLQIVYGTYMREHKSIFQQHMDGDIAMKTFIMSNYKKIKDMFYNYDAMMKEAKPPEFPIDSFIDSEAKRVLVSHDWSHRELGQKKKCIVLQGKSNTGKTKLAKAIFKNPLIVRHMDKLKRFDPIRHDGIVFDDMSFAHYPREVVLNLMDMDDDTDQNVKNGMVTIPAGHPRIFTTNRKMYATFSQYDDSYDKSTSFLPEPLKEQGAEGAQIHQTDSAIMNRFKLITVNDALYACGFDEVTSKPTSFARND